MNHKLYKSGESGYIPPLLPPLLPLTNWGLGQLTAVVVGATEDVVGAHLLVGRAVAVEPEDEVAGQRVVGHQAVGTVLPLQFLQLEPPLSPVSTARQQDYSEEQETNPVQHGVDKDLLDFAKVITYS